MGASPSDDRVRDSSLPAEWGPVLAELDYCDGPRGGLTEIGGEVWYFQSTYADIDSSSGEVFQVWRADRSAVELEREAYRIFVAWNDDYEAGRTTVETHPANGGMSDRYDAIEAELEAVRRAPPGALRMTAEFRFSDQTKRYDAEGLDYNIRFMPVRD